MALSPPALSPPSAVKAAARQHVTYASWYGWGFAKRRTASGEVFNPMALTAAHRTLPLGSRVRVTNLTNGRSVILRITDRGPYHKGRGIDVSQEAARRLRMVRQGVARVRVEELPASPDMDPMPTASAAWPSPTDGPRALSL
jgi:rare lipoprotein A